MEFARMKDDEKVWFDEFDNKYLNQFPKLAWRQALMYRYSPAVLQQPEPEVRDVVVHLQENGTQVKKTLKVNVYARHLIEKLTTLGYDPAKFNVSRGAAINTLKAMEAGEQGSFSIHSAKTDHAPKDKYSYNTKKDYSYAAPSPETFRHKTTERVVMSFDPYDHKFLAAFKKYPQFKTRALMMRYSGELLNGGNYQNLTFKTPMTGQQVSVENVPVFPQQLKQKLDELKAKGVDFFSKPMTKLTAANFLKNGTYNPSYHSKVGVGVPEAPRIAAQAPATAPPEAQPIPMTRRAAPTPLTSPDVIPSTGKDIRSKFYKIKHPQPKIRPKDKRGINPLSGTDG